MSYASLARKILAAAVLAAVASPAAAIDWKYIGRERSDLVHYIDEDSINRRGSVAAFWTMTVRGDPAQGGEVVERLGTAHCTDHAYKVIEERLNPETRLRQPTWVVAFRGSWRTFEPGHKVPEGSPLRAIIDMACGTTEIAPIVFPQQAPAPEPAPPPASEPTPEHPPAEGQGAEPPVVPQGPAAWVDLGASITGQAILVDAATIRDEDGRPTAWFRLVNPDDEDPLPVSYLLRVDCKRRTITQLGLRKYDEQGALAEERDYGEEGEGPMEVEPETVMEIAWTSFCTGEGIQGVRALAGLPPVAAGPADGPEGP